MTTDELFFLTENSRFPSSDLNTVGNGLNSNIHPFQFLFSLTFILILIYLLGKVLKIINKNEVISESFLLKEQKISNSLKIQFIKLNKKLYICTNNGNSITLLDIIKDESEILDLLTPEQDKNSPKWWYKFFKKPNLLNKPIFEETLKNIIKNTDEIEKINQKLKKKASK